MIIVSEGLLTLSILVNFCWNYSLISKFDGTLLKFFCIINIVLKLCYYSFNVFNLFK